MTPPDLSEVYKGPVDWPELGGAEPLEARQARWRADLARAIYGPMPDAPDRVEVRVEPLDGERAERVVLTIEVGGRAFEVDAALWRPEGDGPAPLIAGLSFAGPAGVLTGTAFPLDPKARIYVRPELGGGGGLNDILRGTEGHRWPVDLLNARGFAVLVSCYGSWVPDDPIGFGEVGLRPFLGIETGAISLWGWAISRLIDAAGQLGGLDVGETIVAGHSRLGKAALWAAAHDGRVGTVLANGSGCGGSAPARHAVGETLVEMRERFPHWVRPFEGMPPVDQHQLIAAIAPRRVYLSLAEDDLWADPVGSVMALAEASKVWPGRMEWPSPEQVWSDRREVHQRRLGYHIRPGGHEMLPFDWARFLAFQSNALRG